MIRIILTGYIWLYEFSRLSERTRPSGFVSLSGFVRVYVYTRLSGNNPEITQCLDEPDCTVSPDRPKLPVCPGLSGSTVKLSHQSSSDWPDLPDCLDLSRCLVPPDCPRLPCLTDFSVVARCPQTVLYELSLLPGVWSGVVGCPSPNSDVPEPNEGFEEPLES